MAANALDDLWAPPSSRDAFMQGYVKTTVTREDVDPRHTGSDIGHMGYFRQAAELYGLSLIHI